MTRRREGIYRRMRQCKRCATQFTSVERFEALVRVGKPAA